MVGGVDEVRGAGRHHEGMDARGARRGGVATSLPRSRPLGRGRSQFARLLRESIERGSEETLASSLASPELWNELGPLPQGGVGPLDPRRGAVELARMEFNTWYVRGLCRRLLEEGEEYCQIYRAWDGDGSPDECDRLENRVLPVRPIYNAHRAKYHPFRRPEAFSIPSGPRCKHSVRRLPAGMKALIELEEREWGGSFRRQ